MVSVQFLVICLVTFIVWEMNTNISGEILLPFQRHLNPEDVDIWNLHWLTLLIGTHFTNRNAKSCVSFGTKRTCTQGKQVFTLWLQVTNWLLQTSSTSIVSSGSTWFWMRLRPWRAQTGNTVTGNLPLIGVYSGLLAPSSSFIIFVYYGMMNEKIFNLFFPQPFLTTLLIISWAILFWIISYAFLH